MNEIDRDAIIQAAKQAAEQIDGPLSRADFERITGISQYHIYRLFPDGGWSEVKHIAGLKRHPKDNEPVTDDELIDEFHRVVSHLGRLPTWPLFAAHATVSSDVVRRRFGGMTGTLRQYLKWLEVNGVTSPFEDEIRKSVALEPSLNTDKPSVKEVTPMPQWERVIGTEYGAPIDFRGLRHAPINEQGVVFLFGMVAYELGFIVEAVHASFPDCEAKRSVDPKGRRWQRVRIEFEYESSNFRAHGHDSAQCDVIVCWAHNWPDCPLEVVELSRLIHDLKPG